MVFVEGRLQLEIAGGLADLESLVVLHVNGDLMVVSWTLYDYIMKPNEAPLGCASYE